MEESFRESATIYQQMRFMSVIVVLFKNLLAPTGALIVMMVYHIYIRSRQLFQIFTQSIDAIDVTSVTLSRLNSINAIDVIRYLGHILGISRAYLGHI